MNNEEIEQKLKVLYKEKNVNIVIYVKSTSVADIYIDGFEYQLLDDEFFQLLSDNNNIHLLIDVPNFTDISVNSKMIIIDY